jgi:ABC-type lipoprotein export system ATPase subunit
MNDSITTNGLVAVAQKLSKRFKSGSAIVRAVDEVDLSLPRGRIAAIKGPSGCGKSTLLNLLGALDRPDSGRLQVDGVDVTALRGGKEVAYRRAKVGFVFQQFNLIPHLSALENVTLPMELAGVPAARARARGRDLLQRVGISSDKDARHPAKLSGGEQQRVAIARALANDPPIILADEPTANLDSKTGRLIVDLLRSLRDEERTVIIATHDSDIAARADLVLEMSDGRIAAGA